MTSEEYEAAIKALGFRNPSRAALWLGVSAKASQNHANGSFPIPEPTAKLLRLCVRLKLKPEEVE